MSNVTATELASEIAKRITTLRLEKAWTRQTLADQSGVNVHTLKRFERTGQIALERLIAICQSLEMVHELERLFKPRQRVDINNWEVPNKPQRKRGRRRDAKLAIDDYLDK